MTDEELKYYEVLQPVLGKHLKTIATGDRYYHIADKRMILVRDAYNSPYSPDFFKLHCIAIPLPVDPENPERGLWVMIKGLRSLHSRSGEWEVNIFDEGYVIISTHKGKTPALALLKALAAQEGIAI
jgi:hypothetical protein